MSTAARRVGAAAALLGLACILQTSAAAPTTPYPNTITGFDPTLVYISAGPVSSTAMLIWYRCQKWSHANITVTANGASTTFQAGPVTQASDYTGKYVVGGLTPFTAYTYQVACVSTNAVSALGSFKTPPGHSDAAPVKFAWAADINGQGWGRSDSITAGPYTGGMIFAQAIADFSPDFVYMQGDTIYADGVINPSQAVDPRLVSALGFSTYTNTYIKPIVANTLGDFRLAWCYGLGDDKFRNMIQTHTMVYGWDDHEVANNWYPTRVMDLVKFGGISGAELASVSRQAFYEYNTRPDDQPIYSVYHYGKHLDFFVLDARSYRGSNMEANSTTESTMLGSQQERWFLRELSRSKATWKIVGFDGPISIVVDDGPGASDSYASGNDAVTGREFQLARILKFIKDRNIKGFHAITSDVHYEAVIDYDPAKATGSSEFTPFSEWVIGPSHAGAFGPGPLDNTFGPTYTFLQAPGTEPQYGGAQNVPPPQMQSFGTVEVSSTGDLTISIVGIDNTIIATRTFLKSER